MDEPQHHVSSQTPADKDSAIPRHSHSLMDVLRPATPPKAENAKQILVVGVATESAAAAGVVDELTHLPADASLAQRAKAERLGDAARRRLFRRSSLAAAASLLGDHGDR